MEINKYKPSVPTSKLTRLHVNNTVVSILSFYCFYAVATVSRRFGMLSLSSPSPPPFLCLDGSSVGGCALYTFDVRLGRSILQEMLHVGATL